MEPTKLESVINNESPAEKEKNYKRLQEIKEKSFEEFKTKNIDLTNIPKMFNYDKILIEIFRIEVPRNESSSGLLVPNSSISSTLDVSNYVSTENIVDIYLYPYAKVYAIGESLKSKDFFKDIAAGDIVRLSMELMTMIPNPAYEDYLNTLNERPKKYMTAPSQYIPSIDRYKGMKFPISPLNPVPSDDYMYLIPGTFIDCTL